MNVTKPNPIDIGILPELNLAVEQALSQMFNVKVQSETEVFETHSSTSGDVSGILDLTSETLIGSLVVIFKRTTLLNILSELYRRDLRESDRAIADGAGEITNIIFGILKHRLSKKQMSLKMTVPKVLTGDGHRIVFDSWTLSTRFTSTAGEFTVLVTRIPEEIQTKLKIAS
jgi:CheY-specific phosphatase CheX